MAADELADPIDVLRRHQYVSLTTYRKSGVAMPTPVWFAVSGDKLYVKTGRRSGKAKRIRNNPRVEVAPCTNMGKLRGPAFPATARDIGADSGAEAAFRSRYGFKERVRSFVLRRRGIEPTILEITPDAPDAA